MTARPKRRRQGVKHLTRVRRGRAYRCPLEATQRQGRIDVDAAKDGVVVQVRDLRPLPGDLPQPAQPALL